MPKNGRQSPNYSPTVGTVLDKCGCNIFHFI